jgi:signal transduction histidine kinase
MGIPQQEQDHIFVRFFRAKNALNYPGTGLGLNIVKKYVEIMHGDIQFESQVNTGTTFYITFPRSD